MTLATVSKRIAVCLQNNLGTDSDSMEVYAYGLEILLGAVIKLGVILILASALNTLITTSIVLVAYAAVRCFGGGVHMSTYAKCLIVGTTIIVSLGAISQIDPGRTALIALAIIALIFEFSVCFIWAPGDTEKKPIKDERIRWQQKKKMALVIVLSGLIIVYLIQQNSNIYALAVILGSMSSAFLITPWGYRLLESIDKMTGKEVTINEVQTP